MPKYQIYHNTIGVTVITRGREINILGRMVVLVCESISNNNTREWYLAPNVILSVKSVDDIGGYPAITLTIDGKNPVTVNSRRLYRMLNDVSRVLTNRARGYRNFIIPQSNRQQFLLVQEDTAGLVMSDDAYTVDTVSLTNSRGRLREAMRVIEFGGDAIEENPF